MNGPLRKYLFIACCATLVACSTNAAAASDLQTFQDPSENAYSLKLPAGWNNRLGIRRTNGEMQVPRQWATAVSPDGQTQWFIGDPNIPFFQARIPQQVLAQSGMPEAQIRAFFSNFMRQRGIVMLPYQSAQQFAADYANRRFGQQPGFRILDATPNPQLQQAINAQKQKMGIPPEQVSTTTVRFEYAGHAGAIWASTAPMTGEPDMWVAEVSGFTTAGDVAKATALFNRAALSLDVNLSWVQAERQRSAQRHAAIQQRTWQQNQSRMQNSQAQHQARMQARQNAFNAHQARMAGNSAAMDQQHQSWMNNQNRDYQQHQSYVRSIHDRTLVNSGGNSWEVDAGSNHYYVDELNNRYIGTDQPFDAGQMPDGYQQAEEYNASDWGNW